MPKLTKHKCLEACAELWAWVGRNPSRFKLEWPGWAHNGGELEMYGAAACPACDYVRGANGTVVCERCLLAPLWQVPKGYDVPCCNERSPYAQFRNGAITQIGQERNRVCANQIVQFCHSEIERLKDARTHKLQTRTKNDPAVA